MTSELTEALLTLVEAKYQNIRASLVKTSFTQTIFLVLLCLSCSFVSEVLKGLWFSVSSARTQ